MGKFREAAAVLFKREFGIYGIEKIMHIAEESGYKLDSYGNVLHVEDEKEAFDRLCGNIELELGPIAVIGSKTALMRFFAKDAGHEQSEEKTGEVLNEQGKLQGRPY